VDAIDGKEMTDGFCRPTPLQDLYKAPPVKESDAATRSDRTIDRTAVWARFVETGRRNLAVANGLATEENDELLHTASYRSHDLAGPHRPITPLAKSC